MEKLLKTKKDKEQFLTWIAWLKSGVFKQTQDSLQDEKGHCCLGVGCELFIPDNKKKFWDIYVYEQELEGEFPNEQPYAPKWLQLIDDDVEAKKSFKISELNDDGKSFKQIANILLNVYKHELE